MNLKNLIKNKIFIFFILPFWGYAQSDSITLYKIADAAFEIFSLTENASELKV